MFCRGRQVFQVGQAPSGPTVIRPLLVVIWHPKLAVIGSQTPKYIRLACLFDCKFAWTIQNAGIKLFSDDKLYRALWCYYLLVHPVR